MARHTRKVEYQKLDLKDSAGLRRRNGPRQPAPAEEITHLNSAHLKILEWVHLYGGFSTTELIFLFAKSEGITKQSAMTYVRDKLLKEAMFHNHGVLERPTDQWNIRNLYSDTKTSHRHYTVYRISEHGEEVLKEAGLWNEHAPKAHGWYKHQLMTACIYQMFYLSARMTGIPFTAQHELKPKAKFIALPQLGKTENIIKVFPDAVFILHYNDHNALYFFEMDRATEKGDAKKNKKITRKTWGKSIEYYKKIFKEKLYLKILDLPEEHVPYLATMSVSANMANKILGHIDDEYSQGCFNMLVHTTRAFGPLPEDFFPPRYFDVLDILWERSNYPAIRLNRRNKDPKKQ